MPLVAPSNTAPVQLAPGQAAYRIRSGDTLWSISRHFGTTMGALLNANPQIEDPDYIKAGAFIYLP